MKQHTNSPERAGSTQPAAGRSALGLIFLIVFIDLLGFAIVLPLLPRYAERFQASPMTIGLLFASFSGMQFLFAPLWGRWSDRVGRRPVLLLGLAGSVVFYALFGVATLAESLALMFLARIGAGICGATISTAQAYIADSTGLRDRAKGMALIGAAFGVGFTFGPILGSIAMPHTVVSPGEPEPLNALPGFLAAGLSLIALALAWIKLPESRRSGSVAAERSWLNIAAIREAMKVPSVGWLLLLSFLTVFAFAQYETTLSLLTERAFGMNERRNFLIFTGIGLTLSISQGVLVRRLAPRLGEGPLVVSGTVLMGAGLLLMALSTGGSLALLLVGLPTVVVGVSFITPSVQAMISRRSDPARQGEILGVNQSLAALGRIVGPVVGNVLFGQAMPLPYQASALLMLPALGMAVITLRQGRDWEAAEPVSAAG